MENSSRSRPVISSSAQTTAAKMREIGAEFNLLLAAFYVLVNVFQFVFLPTWLLPNDIRWGFALLPLALLTNPFWSLIHEAIHDLLHPNRRLNGMIGRLLSVMFGSPFRILRSSHLLHHKLNRAPIEGTEYYERGNTPVVFAALGYYWQIFGGLYLVELLSPLLFFLPRSWLETLKGGVRAESVSGILLRNWSQDRAAKEIRVDGTLVILWFALGFFCYGRNWLLLLLALAARGFLISFLDNVYHYRTPVNDVLYASNLWLPKLLAKPLLNFNLHGIHHRHPSLPWKQLPAAFQEQAQIYQANYFVAAARQLAGPTALQDLPWASESSARAHVQAVQGVQALRSVPAPTSCPPPRRGGG
jgi:fatty acid desaturase